MAVTNFIPTVWTAQILQNLHKSLVYGQAGVINRNYEGEIRDYGDSVKINAIGPITVTPYVSNTNMADPQELTGAQTTLIIDQAKYFNFQVDDIDQAQTKPKVIAEAMREAGYALKDSLDQFLAGKWTDVAAANQIGTHGSPKTDVNTTSPNGHNAFNYLLDLKVMLDEANIPSDGRWCILPPWYEAIMLKDDRFINPGTPQAENRMSNAVIGQAAGFTLLRSNNVPNTSNDNYKVLAGHSMAWTLAEQIVKVEAYRMEKRFADAVKGLHVYGAKVVRPDALALLHVDRP